MKKNKEILIGIIVIVVVVAIITVVNIQKNNGKITLTATMFSSELVGNDELWKYIENKFNVEFEFISVTDDNYEEKNQLLISSGEMPDLLRLDLDESNFSTYANWVKQGSFSAIPSLEELQKDYPNIYAMDLYPDEYEEFAMEVDLKNFKKQLEEEFKEKDK